MPGQFIDNPTPPTTPAPSGQFIDATPPPAAPRFVDGTPQPRFIDHPAPAPSAAPPTPLPAVSALITRHSGGDFALDRLGRIVSGIETSGGRNVKPSSTGAIGIMQIMPDTAREYGFDPSRLNDPGYNITAGMTILKDLLKRSGGDPIKTAVGYNAGPGNMFKAITDLPNETQGYVTQAMTAMGVPGFMPSPTPVRQPAPKPPPVTRPNFVTPSNTMDDPAAAARSMISDPNVAGARAGTASALATVGGVTDIGFILSNAQARDGSNASIMQLLRDPKSHVSQAMALYRRDPAAAADEYGAGSPKQNQFMAERYGNTEAGREAKFLSLHPKTNALVTFFEEMFNPVSYLAGEGAGRALGAVAKSRTAVDLAQGVRDPVGKTVGIQYGAATKAGLGSPYADIYRRGGDEAVNWMRSLSTKVTHEDQAANAMMTKVFADLTQPEQWEVVRLSQDLPPDPAYFGKYTALKKRADMLRADIRDVVTPAQKRVGILRASDHDSYGASSPLRDVRDMKGAKPSIVRTDRGRGSVYNPEVYFPMSGTHDYGPQMELQAELAGRPPAGGTGTTADKARVYDNVDDWRASGTADKDASAAQAYSTWRRQRMQMVAFEDAMARAPESMRRDIKPEDFETQHTLGVPRPEKAIKTQLPDGRTIYHTDTESLLSAVERNNEVYPEGHPSRITLKDQTEYVYAKNALNNTRSPLLQKSMVAPEMWRYLQKNSQFAKYVDQGGSFLPGEGETFVQKAVGLMRAMTIANPVFHPMINIGPNDAAARGLHAIGGPMWETGGAVYNTLKALALQVGLVKPEQFAGGAEQYAHWVDRAMTAGAKAEFGVSRTTLLGGERPRVMTEPIEGVGPKTWLRRIDKAMTGFSDWNAERTFGSKGEGAFVVSLFKDAVRAGKTDSQAATLVRQAFTDYSGFDPRSPLSAAFLFMPWLKGNTKFWTSILVKRPQYVTGPQHAIRDYNQQTGDPAYQGDQRFPAPDFRVYAGSDPKTGTPNYWTPPFVFRDMAHVANVAGDAAKGSVGDVAYEGDAMLEGRANPFMRGGIDFVRTLAASADSKDVAGPETDYKLIWNPKAPDNVKQQQIAAYAISHFVPVPLVGYALQDAARKGFTADDLRAAFIDASGAGFASEGTSDEQRADVSRAKRQFLKAYYQAQDPGADPQDWQNAWSDYTDALKAAGVIK